MTSFLTRRTALATGLAITTALASGATWAQSYPTKPIKLVVPYAAGGATDIVARTIGEKLSSKLGQPVLVDNRAGAGGIMGTDAVAKAQPDGYTFLVSLGTTLLINQFLYDKLPYKPGQDFALMTQIAMAPVTLLVHPSSPVKNANDLTVFIKQNKGKLTYGSWGAGSYAHLGGAYLSQSLSADMVHAAYKGEAPMLQDLAGGQIHMAFASLQSAKPYIDAGKLRVIAVTGEQRMASLPNVSTLREQGIKDDIFRVTGWMAMAAPAKTPTDIVQRVATEVRAICNLPEVRERIAGMGFIPVANTPEEFATAYKKDHPVWERVVQMTGAKLD
jgi:tripartite-type tricarboxylate transporter receptor subunit TctC